MKYIQNINHLIFLPKQFYLFSYGSNNIKQLSDRLKCNIKNVIQSTRPGTVYNYERSFFYHLRKWNGSVATICKNRNRSVEGIFTKIVKNRNKFSINGQNILFINLVLQEGLHKNIYYLKHINNYKSTPIYAFIGNIKLFPNIVEQPSGIYLEAICKMLLDRRMLKNISVNRDDFIIKINQMCEKIIENKVIKFDVLLDYYDDMIKFYKHL